MEGKKLTIILLLGALVVFFIGSGILYQDLSYNKGKIKIERAEVVYVEQVKAKLQRKNRVYDYFPTVKYVDINNHSQIKKLAERTDYLDSGDIISIYVQPNDGNSVVRVPGNNMRFVGAFLIIIGLFMIVALGWKLIRHNRKAEV